MNQEKNSFLLYTEQYELVEQLSNEQAGMLFKALYEYVSSGEMSELDALSKLVFTSIRQDLDRNAEKYEEIVEKRRIAGSIGGRKRAEKYSKNLEQENVSYDEFVANAKFAKINSSKSAYYDNENENDNDNVNVNENVNDNLSLLSEREERDYKGEERDFKEKERIKDEISSIHDKTSAYKVLAKYYCRGKPPKEFYEIMLKDDLNTFDKGKVCSRELAGLTPKEGIPPPAPPT